MNKKISTIEAENKSALQKIEYLNSEIGIEKEAKARLNLKKEGENVVVVIPTKSGPKDNNNYGGSLWDRLKKLFGF